MSDTTIIFAPVEERKNKTVLDRNLEKVLGINTQEKLIGESMGGNAGYKDGLPCSAVNWTYNPRTGDIELSNRPTNNPNLGSMCLKVDYFGVPIEALLEGPKPVPEAEKIMQETLKQYNLYTRKEKEKVMQDPEYVTAIQTLLSNLKGEQ